MKVYISKKDDMMMEKSKQYFDKPIIEVIRERSSVRSYRPKKLTQTHQEYLKSFMKALKGPFDPKVRFEILDEMDIKNKAGEKIGTYGVIKGANTYIAAVVEKGEKDLEELGYVFEKVILCCTSLGLGTCWLGGTFKRGGFEKAMAVKEIETLPVVTPIGYPAEKKSLIEKVMRLGAGSNQRKSWDQLFFSKDFQHSLKEEEAEGYSLPLEMVRLGPSASNKQPWRILKDEDGWHFYLKSNKGYSNALGFDIQRIDIGIAMCHFEMTSIELGLKGSWKIFPNKLHSVPDSDTAYIVSWRREH